MDSQEGLADFISFTGVLNHLHRWSGDDSQALHKLVRRYLRDSALLIDHDLLVERTLGRIALALAGEDRPPPGDSVLKTLVEGAAKELMAEDWMLAGCSDQGSLDPDFEVFASRYGFLADCVGIAGDRAGAAAIAYNALAWRTRRAFWLLILEGEAHSVLVGGEWATEQELRDDVLTAFEALLGKERTGR